VICMDAIDSLVEEFRLITGFLRDGGQISLSIDVDRHFKKVIILSSASYFEYRIQNILIGFVAEKSGNNNELISFFKKRAIGMQYHSLFTWGEKNDPDKPGKNANTFLSLFGDEFKQKVGQEINNNDVLSEAMKAFLEIGHLRNILVHSNFAVYPMDDNITSDEIYGLHKKGRVFVEFIEGKL